MDKEFKQTFPTECDKAIASGNIKTIDITIEKLEKLKSNVSEGLVLTHILYCLSNLHFTKAGIENERIDQWRKSKSPQNLVKSLNYVRQAYSMAIKFNSLQLLEIQTNLANNIKAFNRFVEAIHYYTFDYNFNLQIDSQYVAPYNKAYTLILLKDLINEQSVNIHYSYYAYSLIDRLSQNQEKITHAGIKNHIEKETWVKNILLWGKSAESEYKKLNKLLNSTQFDNIEQKIYYSWCGKNKLFLNPINDVRIDIATFEDTIQFPNYIVKVGEGPYFSAAFSDIKNRFCKARYLLFNALNNPFPAWLENGLNLTSVLEYENYSTNAEFIKVAIKLAFSTLDSLATLMKNYFEINCKNDKCYFKPSWIRESFTNIQNPYIDALYWLSCDLTDTDNIKNWNAPNPSAGILRKLRNDLEHNWVRISEAKSTVWLGEQDYAMTYTLEQISTAALEVFRYVRTAIIYFILAVQFNEKLKNEKESDGLCVTMETPTYNDLSSPIF